MNKTEIFFRLRLIYGQPTKRWISSRILRRPPRRPVLGGQRCRRSPAGGRWPPAVATRSPWTTAAVLAVLGIKPKKRHGGNPHWILGDIINEVEAHGRRQ